MVKMEEDMPAGSACPHQERSASGDERHLCGYLGGSGFLVSLGDIGMLFDASETGPDQRRLPAKETLARFRKPYVFISHHHDDHFRRPSMTFAERTQPIFSASTFLSPIAAFACLGR